MPARILVIEDNETHLELMLDLLRAFGHTTIAARDGQEGVELIESQVEAPDLIVCDLQMPRMDGYGVARKLRTDPVWRSIPLVAITAYAMVGDRAKTLASGFDGYFSKPIEPETFMTELETFLPQAKRSSGQPIRPGALPIPSPGSGKPPAMPLRSGTVLVVNDSPANLSLISTLLESSGFEVLPVETVEDALQLAGTTEVDIIITDIHLPTQSGFDLVRRARRDPKLKAVPIMFTSATHLQVVEQPFPIDVDGEAITCCPLDPAILLKQVQARIRSH